ncbi:MAG: hypothetical protein A2W80_17055 [Candidatus Riflebacteria bacterium GWC2_50_8]|nr:MAG: hypothetical protein A2W80_17055 [Candidatus Riflebacteria bacterium GWC2_50_8]
MNRFAIVFSVLLLLITPISSSAESGSLEEIRQYFELRDTVSLINLEMKRAMAPDSKSPLLIQSGAEHDLADVINFLEGRIAQFAGIDTPLKYHYIKKLNALLKETRQLQAALVVKMRASALSAMPGSTLAKEPPATPGGELKTHPRPYFHPIDLRTLLSPGLQNAKTLQFNNASASIEPVTTKIPESKPGVKSVSQPVSSPVPRLIAPSSPFPANMPQKTPILVKPVQIMAPPAETKIVKSAEKPTSSVNELAIRPPAPASVSAEIASQPEAVKKPAREVVAVSRPSPASVKVVEPAPIIDSAPAVEPVAASVATSLPVQVVEPLPVAVPVVIASPAQAVTPLPVVAPITVAATPTSVVIDSVDVASAGSVMRPLAVMIENHNQSRPQSGLDQADLVYEMPVEGGITRFMAVYTRLPGILGPVRSCREYFVDRALEVDALYVHCGSSPSGYAYLSKSGINSVDEIKHSPPFFRDSSRKAPHNLYGKGQGILNYMSDKVKMHLPAAPKLMNYGISPVDAGEAGESVRIKYHGNYTLEFKFENGAYQRYMNNVLHIDRETQLPLRASAVVVQVATMQVIDKAGRQEMSFIGSGKAWILENGRMTKVTWLKKKPRELTSYKDAAGRDYLFPKGLPVWVQVVSPAHKLVFNGVEDITPLAGKEGGEPASASAEIGKQG